MGTIRFDFFGNQAMSAGPVENAVIVNVEVVNASWLAAPATTVYLPVSVQPVNMAPARLVPGCQIDLVFDDD